MVTFTVGSVVLIPFPFSDLSNSKLRPGKLFTAHSTLIRRRVGQLKSEVLKQIVDKIKNLIDDQ